MKIKKVSDEIKLLDVDKSKGFIKPSLITKITPPKLPGKLTKSISGKLSQKITGKIAKVLVVNLQKSER